MIIIVYFNLTSFVLKMLVYEAVPADGGISLSDLNNLVGESVSKIGLGQCMKSKWVKKEGEKIIKIMFDLQDTTRDILKAVNKNHKEVPEEEIKNLKRRKLVDQIVRKSSKVTKGPCFKPTRTRKMADLNKDM